MRGLEQRPHHHRAEPAGMCGPGDQRATRRLRARRSCAYGGASRSDCCECRQMKSRGVTAGRAVVSGRERGFERMLLASPRPRTAGRMDRRQVTDVDRQQVPRPNWTATNGTRSSKSSRASRTSGNAGCSRRSRITCRRPSPCGRSAFFELVVTDLEYRLKDGEPAARRAVPEPLPGAQRRSRRPSWN